MTTLTGNYQPLSAIQTAGARQAGSNIGADTLLAALVGFIQPIIRVYVPSSVATQDKLATDHSSGLLLGLGSENAGRKLINALEEFIVATVHPQSTDSEGIAIVNDALDSGTKGPSTGKTVSTTLSIPSIPTPMTNEDILRLTAEELRPHIFNNMPIRMLVFDENGTGIRLIERNELFRQVQKSIYAAVAIDPVFNITAPELDWEGGTELRAEEIEKYNEIYERMITMIQELVCQHTKYAILSHTWIREGPGDVVYQDWATRTENPVGYAKISKFCQVAATHHGVRFGWMDTVCINKDSSSELDESIRSMYKWYRGAHVCVAYLAETRTVAAIIYDSWFHRGWTLQELLAPTDIKFYNMHWEVLGEAGDPKAANVPTIEKKIAKATGITSAELTQCRRGAMDKLPVSRIFDMAVSRQVTREEDTAYSLMGLLGVDIPTAYGEGAERALFRLLRELLGTKKHVLDIFNHEYRDEDNTTLIPRFIDQYRFRTYDFDSSDGQTASLLDQWQSSEPIILTHLGVRIPLLLVPGLPQSESRSDIESHSEPTSDIGSQSDSRSNIEEFVPKGNFFGNVKVRILPTESTHPCDYNLLDARIYKADTNSNVSPFYIHEGLVQGSSPSVRTFGVLNFGMDNESILLPQRCLAIVLDCGTMKPGEVHPSDGIKIQPVDQLPVFQLKSTGQSFHSIPKGDLKIHGMQLVTLYL